MEFKVGKCYESSSGGYKYMILDMKTGLSTIRFYTDKNSAPYSSNMTPSSGEREIPRINFLKIKVWGI
jgi:hypothetical protein